MMLNLRRRGYRFRIYFFAGLMVLLVVVGSAFTIGIAWYSKQIATRIVGKDFKAREIERALVDLLLSMDHNRKQYFILEKPEYRDRFNQDAERFQEKLSALEALGLSDIQRRSMRALGQEFSAYIQRDPFSNQEDFSLYQDTPNVLLGELDRLLRLNQDQTDLQIEEMNRMEGKTIRISTSWAVMSLLVAGLLSLLLIHSITHPIGLLQKGTREIAEGRFSHRVYLPSHDELGRLANAFNDMAYQLKKLDEMKADFMAIVSHELKTPLTSVNEAVELLREGAVGTLNTKQRHLLDISAQGIQKLAGLIDEILNLTKLEGGMVDLDQSWFDCKGLIEDKLRRFCLIADKKRIRLYATFDPEHMPPIYADADRLRQVMANLLSNAIRFTPSGGRVSVHVKYNKDPDNWFQIRVSDTGEGIPREERERIFEKFYQIQGTSSRAGGSGLGLTISKHIIEAHGGAIWVEDSLDKGATFVFKLPQERVKEQSEFLDESLAGRSSVLSA